MGRYSAAFVASSTSQISSDDESSGKWIRRLHLVDFSTFIRPFLPISTQFCDWCLSRIYGLFDRSSRERFHIMPPRMQRGSTDSPGNFIFSSPYFSCFSTERKGPKHAKKSMGSEGNWIGWWSVFSQFQNRFPSREDFDAEAQVRYFWRRKIYATYNIGRYRYLALRGEIVR